MVNNILNIIESNINIDFFSLTMKNCCTFTNPTFKQASGVTGWVLGRRSQYKQCNANQNQRNEMIS
jgi:hypothetical protein